MILALLLAASVIGPSSDTTVVDAFDKLESWTAHPADGVIMSLSRGIGRRNGALRVDYGFSGGGYAIARRTLSLDLPSNYAFTFWIKGVGGPNTLEFKLIDESGENVWWYTERDRVFNGEWHKVTIRKRQISFAWGPQGGGEATHIAGLELVITAGSGGGKGSVWFDDLELAPRPVSGPYRLTPRLVAHESTVGHPATMALDGDSATSWRAVGPTAELTIDFLQLREFGGFTILWEVGRAPRRFVLMASDDGQVWRTLGRRVRGVGAVDHFLLPDAEARYLRIGMLATDGRYGYGIRELRVETLETGASRNAFFTAVAHDAPRGAFPRYLLGERADWTVIGVPGAREEALLNEDGALEVGSGAFSVEPFLFASGHLASWADGSHRATLAQERLPVPSVEWSAGPADVLVTAFARGPVSSSSVVARYRITNRGSVPMHGKFFLAVRPFQVNPPWQFLGIPGGVTPVASLQWTAGRLQVNGDRYVIPVRAPSEVGVVPFGSGDIVECLRAGAVPNAMMVQDPFEAASGAMGWVVNLAAGASTTVAIEVPLVPGVLPPAPALRTGDVDTALAKAEHDWSVALDSAAIDLPSVGQHLAHTITSTLGYIAINRDGPAIQPGSRSYERSWIRDGALTSAALLRFGQYTEVKDFLLWFATHQYPNGKIPCCVDRRGADPVPEYDSNGEFIYLVMEYFRHTGDRAVLQQLWPSVQAATHYLDSLRRTERTPEFRVGDNRLYFGLLPPSISHEGYSAKPMHSYWDDFFALRGFKDAVTAANVLGDAPMASRFTAMRDEFAMDLYASITAVMAERKIDFIPGAADLGDFDATSTTIAIAPVGELDRLPRRAFEATFERYWRDASARHDPGAVWEAYTPYELRTVGAMLRLGWKERALTMMHDFLTDQEPAGWNQWPEVVWHDAHAPKFIGDMPHTWVGSDFLRSAADLFVYERESDSALVIGQGIAEAWLADPGVAVRNLSTWWGRVSYQVVRSADRTTLSIGPGVAVPPGGIIVFPPGSRPARRVAVNGLPAVVSPDGSINVRVVPATITFEP